MCCQKSKKLMSKIQDLPICFCLTKSFHSSPVQTLVPRYAAENLSDWRVLSFLHLPEFIFKKILTKIKFTPNLIHTTVSVILILKITTADWANQFEKSRFKFVCLFFCLILIFHNFSSLIKKKYIYLFRFNLFTYNHICLVLWIYIEV